MTQPTYRVKARLLLSGVALVAAVTVTSASPAGAGGGCYARYSGEHSVCRDVRTYDYPGNGRYKGTIGSGTRTIIQGTDNDRWAYVKIPGIGHRWIRNGYFN
jgi:hypothetical protein